MVRVSELVPVDVTQDDAGADVLGDLDGEMADAAGRGVGEHGLPGPEAGVIH